MTGGTPHNGPYVNREGHVSEDCDHCDGTGLIWESCGCYECEYDAKHSRWIQCANCGRMPENATKPLTSTLVLEVELPTFYAEDMRADDEHWRQWLAEMEVDPSDPVALGQEILGNIGEVFHGLLTIEVSGEKDGETIRTPVLMVGARIEDRPPTPEEKWKDALDDLEHEIDDPINEVRVLSKMDRAELAVLNRFVRLIRDEYTGQVSEMAAQAIQEAKLASDEAERRYAPDV